ncbi:glycosyltransferase family 2 protein [Thermococcus sp. Bubb.Bath]|uniref:glycosyltransferase n=1 Tax=Thermococcus sp. Bubb.Bath TaxID=1638242 RepID=UPI00143B5141|nr:glycosyltransferase family 2 protein [Thermococcus sp. Bubb.Bath]NJF24678.1 glycosyltransferase family 2 protein [Thermococcus sp. Bubb.Bath]
MSQEKSEKPKVSIIIPTYNERDNLDELFERISRALSEAGYDFEIVVVDDNSPDRTWEYAEELGKTRGYPVKVIRRVNEKGLSSAVIRGFKEASGDVFVVMDADLQHPPEKIPKLVRAIEEGADIVIASRYVPGGGVRNWYWYRKLISKGAIMIGRVALPKIRNVRDPVSGFFALKREVVENAELNPIGFKILMEILIKGTYKKVVEVPFTFGLRKAGESKLSGKTMINYLKHVYRLMKWEGELDRLIKFSIVGTSGIFVNEGFLWFFVRFLGWSKVWANIPAIELSILNNFTWNDLWTFRDLRKRPLWRRLLSFHAAALTGAAVQMAIYAPLVYIGVHYLIANLIGIAASFIVRFLFNRNVTWG